jgi:hypothetical protein
MIFDSGLKVKRGSLKIGKIFFLIIDEKYSSLQKIICSSLERYFTDKEKLYFLNNLT